VSAAVRTPAEPRTPRSAAGGLGRVATGLSEAAGQLPVITAAVGVAWLLIATAQLTDTAGLLHHHALIEHGPPLWISVPTFLGAWLVMIVAMMIPASLPAIAAYATSIRHARLWRFLAPYALAWAGFGLAVFAGDALLHHVVDTTPWLAARPWLIDASVIGIAGTYQLTPFKRRSLDACRHPAMLLAAADAHGRRGAGPGVAHAAACLAASWALMLLMFAEGFSNPIPMLGLAVAMAYETTGRYGQLVRWAVGAGLLLIACGVLLGGTSV
jgi:predicted metal-binding membrane protein